MAADGSEEESPITSWRHRRASRLALLVYGTARFDSRTWRIAHSAMRAGYEVVVYARWEPGLPRDAVEDGIHVVRVPPPARALVFWPTSRLVLRVPDLPRLPFRRRSRREAVVARAPHSAASRTASGASADELPGEPTGRAGGLAGRVRRWLRFPHSVLPWAAALDAVVDPADIWVARLVGGLPAAVRQAKRLGGAAIYDSGDVYVQSRELAGGGIYAGIVAWWERRLARSCAAVTTVNDPYARLLERQLRVPRPQVVMNCPPRYDPPEPRPELLRAALGLPAETRVALYQGALLTGRGLEQAMSAVVEVPETVLAILGFGGARDAIDRRARQKPYSGRVHLLPPVAPAELLDWVASADVVLLPLQDSSPNHRYSTPNKLFEALAVGTPVVASDLPGLASVVRDTGCGELVDGADPTAIAAGIRRIVDAPREEREALRARCLRAAHERYDWEGQEGVLLEVFRKVLSR